MRGPRYSVRKLPILRDVGKRARETIEMYMAALPDHGNLVGHFGKKPLGDEGTEEGRWFKESCQQLAERHTFSIP